MEEKRERRDRSKGVEGWKGERGKGKENGWRVGGERGSSRSLFSFIRIKGVT